MTKQELAAKICREIGGYTVQQISDIVTFILNEMTKALANGEEVKLTNFGKFDVHNKGERMGRNPKTMEPSVIKARKIVRFRQSRNVGRLLNV